MEEFEIENPELGSVSEGWWASVMEEDECYSRASQRKKMDEGSKVVSSEAQVLEHVIDWNYVRKLYEQESVITGTVVDYNKGGLLVCDQKFQGFIPISHLDDVLVLEDEAGREERLRKYLGCRLIMKVIECDEGRGRIVLSERAAQTEPGQRSRLMQVLKIGQIMTGRVTNITDFGVFVDLGGVEGLVHISELSWGRVIHPCRHAEIGREINVQVLGVNKEQCRVSLSVKRMQPNPWNEVLSRYSRGAKVVGRITEIVKYGAFARLEDGLEGLIHISEMGQKQNGSLEEILNVGQEVNVEVVLLDPERQRMSLRLIE